VPGVEHGDHAAKFEGLRRTGQHEASTTDHAPFAGVNPSGQHRPCRPELEGLSSAHDEVLPLGQLAQRSVELR